MNKTHTWLPLRRAWSFGATLLDKMALFVIPALQKWRRCPRTRRGRSVARGGQVKAEVRLFLDRFFGR